MLEIQPRWAVYRANTLPSCAIAWVSEGQKLFTMTWKIKGPRKHPMAPTNQPPTPSPSSITIHFCTSCTGVAEGSVHHAQSHISRTCEGESLSQLLKHSRSKTSNDKEIAQVQRILILDAPSPEAAQRDQPIGAPGELGRTGDILGTHSGCTTGFASPLSSCRDYHRSGLCCS